MGFSGEDAGGLEIISAETQKFHSFEFGAVSLCPLDVHLDIAVYVVHDWLFFAFGFGAVDHVDLAVGAVGDHGYVADPDAVADSAHDVDKVAVLEFIEDAGNCRSRWS